MTEDDVRAEWVAKYQAADPATKAEFERYRAESERQSELHRAKRRNTLEEIAFDFHIWQSNLEEKAKRAASNERIRAENPALAAELEAEIVAANDRHNNSDEARIWQHRYGFPHDEIDLQRRLKFRADIALAKQIVAVSASGSSEPVNLWVALHLGKLPPKIRARLLLDGKSIP